MSTTTAPAALVWIVVTASAYRASHTCLLGSGPTRAAALEDSFGPKDQWGNSAKRAARSADVYQVTPEELADLEANR